MATRNQTHAHHAPVAEWITAAIGAVLVGVTLGILIYDGVVAPASEAAIAVVITGITETPAGYLVALRLENSGTETAASVHVRGELLSNGNAGEEADTVVDYVAGKSSATATLQFAHNPRHGQLSVKVKGYEHP